MVGQVARVLLSVYFGLLCIPCLGQVEQAATPKEITNSIGMKFVWIPAGRFTMGSPASERGSQEDEVLHKVELTKAFHLGATEVTEHQWATVMEEPFETKVVEVRDPETKRLIKKEERKVKNPKLGSELPVTGVSWTQAVEYCERLAQLPEEKKTRRTYRLPTEAEWEYASRAGSTTAYSFGDDATQLGDCAWFGANSGGEGPSPVGQKAASAWSLYDMHGNVAEWCHDYYGAYKEGLVSNPFGPDVLLSLNRIIRGGAFDSKESQCRSGWRGQCPDQGDLRVGFRVLMGEMPPAAGSEWIENSLGQRLVKIPPGVFLMGSPKSDSQAYKNERPQRTVKISRSFYIGETEVTQGQWKAVMGTELWKGEKNVREGDHYAATYISFDDVVMFCDRLSKQEGKTYRLPTEAEWEYACRGGATTKYSFGDDAFDLLRYGWFDGNTVKSNENYAHEVKQKLANPFGLYDMHGNVWEWCSDWYGDYTEGLAVDPTGPSEGSKRVNRGGSWSDAAWGCRSALRLMDSPDCRSSYLGFRLVLVNQ